VKRQEKFIEGARDGLKTGCSLRLAHQRAGVGGQAGEGTGSARRRPEERRWKKRELREGGDEAERLSDGNRKRKYEGTLSWQ